MLLPLLEHGMYVFVLVLCFVHHSSVTILFVFSPKDFFKNINTYFIKVIFHLVSIVLGLISLRQNFSVFLEYEKNVSYFMVYIHR